MKWLKLWKAPLQTPQQWGMAVIIALMLAFAPQISPNDWSLNTDGLYDWLNIYQNPDYVYPPWALVLLWPYRLMTAPGSLVFTGLVIAWLVYRQRWPLALFLAIIVNPFFVFTMLFSNVDILVMIFPLLLWQAVSARRWRALPWGSALAIMLLKPQGVILIIPYLLWRWRAAWRDLLAALGVAALIIVPVSLLGSPPLITQWLHNITHPSALNLERWGANSVALGGEIGTAAAALVLAVIFAGLSMLMRQLGKQWTENHTIAVLFLAAMLASPYTSNQSIIVPLAFVPSWSAVIIQYVGTFLTDFAGVYGTYDSWWTLLFGLAALWFYQPQTVDQSTEAAIVSPASGATTTPEAGV